MKKLSTLGIAALTIALAACGGGNGSKAPSTTQTVPAATTAAPTTVAPTTAAPTTTAEPATTQAPTTAAPTTTVAPTTEAPTTTVDPVVAAQGLYFGLSGTYNQANADANATFSSSTSKLPAYCAKLAAAEEAFAQGIQTGPWPASAQDEADALAKAAAADAGAMFACANAKGSSNIRAAYNATAATNEAATEASSAMRLALGLPLDRS